MNPLSIGNFFHEDLAYLAELEATGHVSPEVEQKQAAWWKLLLWYVNDDLKEIEQSLHGQPFLKWVPKRGGRAEDAPAFDRMRWLERDGRVIGIISPVLLVRPLPDEKFTGSPWGTMDAPVTERVRARLAALVNNLNEERDEARQRNTVPFCCRLAPIITARGLDLQSNTADLNVIMTRFSFLDPYTLETTEILVPTGDGKLWIPKCDNCMAPMLPATARIGFATNTALLTCPQCGSTKQFALSDFGCAWVDGELVVWRDRALQWADGTKLMPPTPAVNAEQRKVTFAYPAISVLANLTARDLTFELEVGTTFKVIERLADLNYSSYLWPGDPDPSAPVTATPLPIRIENARLVNNARTRRINKTVEVTIGLKGLPADVRWIFLPSALSASAIAIYPNPKNVPPQWSWFDIATDATLQIHGHATTARGVGAHRVRIESRAVDLPAVELTNGSRASCTLLLSRVDTRQSERPIEVAVGFDFGSSNTALRFSLDGTHDNSRALTGAELRKSVAALTISPQFDEAADRLAPRSAADDASFESLHCQEHNAARVVGAPCCGRVQPGDVLFKSDPRREQVRIEYLSEMLIHGLIGAARHFGDRPLNVSGVFSYPLTFTKPRLSQFEQEVKTVIERVALRTGGDAAVSKQKTKFVDEATAGVRSLGQPQATEIVLTADLGGGTLDISLGRSIDGSRKDQIGSLEVGGSYFLKRGSTAGELEAYASAATSVARGQVDRREWFKRKAEVDRYYALLFIELETVLGSYITRRGADLSVEIVTLYPLGNGWRFYELMVDPMQDEPAAFVRSEIGRLAKNLGEAMRMKHGVNLNMTAKLVKNPKEAVASGCLRVATMAGEVETEEVRPRLPLGITASNVGTAVPWHALFEGPIAQVEFVNNALEFDEPELRHRLQTPNGKSWADAPFDAGVLRADLQTEEYRSHRGYERGPMHLLIEKQWLPKV